MQIRDDALSIRPTCGPTATIDLRARRVRWIDTAHIPHGWDADVLHEETKGTLLCGDLFTQLGAGPALTGRNVMRPAVVAEDMFRALSPNPGIGATIRRLAGLAP